MKLSAALRRRVLPHGLTGKVEGTERVELEFPLRTFSESNQRDHWSAKARRVKRQRSIVALVLCGFTLPEFPVVVTLTRLAPGTLDEGDNLPASLKAVRDEVAEQYCMDDGSNLYEWRYAQERSEDYRVRIVIERQAKHFAGKKG